MSGLTTDEGKARIMDAVTRLEAKTCAEVVVALRPRSGDYRRADFAFGALLALTALCVFLYHPEPFDFTLFPLEQTACFALGAVACAHLPWLRRLLTPRRVRRENVASAAQAMFLTQGIDKTQARTGILVYLSSLEREVFLVVDRGIDAAAIAQEENDLRAAFRAGSLEAFVRALDAMGDALAKMHPVSADDVDELPNEVAA